MSHTSVLKEELIRYLNPKANENFIDATLGEAGHSLAILEKTGPKGKILGIDQGLALLKISKKNLENRGFGKRVILVCDNFSNLKKIVKENNFLNADGIIFDLGMSLWHLEKSKRGFSFLRNEFLDMRYSSKKQELTAREIVNNWEQEEIEKILKEYGEEKFVSRISKEIVKSRKQNPITTTFDLVEIIRRVVPGWYLKKRIHPSTKTFMALRIAVNDELENLKKGLRQAIEVIKIGGRIGVVSFHSLEDRIVKNFLREKAKDSVIKILTKKPIRPTLEEVKNNPASRSAKL
ncbi:MAG: 16S rRNA (cytosine(1402)-N(4))-methyltransferase RsmH, partial [Ignavibacteria bacterium]|nr:16S rRNA (cytosine(1402)-N(4))-methyltransferase RsmH [Ignavibacteria bacterium]